MQKLCCVPPPSPFGLAGLSQQFGGVLADGLQQPVPGAVPGRLGGQQRLTDELIHHVQRDRFVPAAAHRGPRRQGKTVGEH